MTDFCIETTAIHDEYIEEYNERFAPLMDILPNTRFICVTTNPDLVSKRDNLKVVDIKKYTETEFKKCYDHKGGFCEILQATRFGLREAHEEGFLKVIHLQTDMWFADDVTEEKLTNHFKRGLYFDMGGSTLNLKLASGDNKSKYLAEKYINSDRDLETLPVGDDPVALFKFKSLEEFHEYNNNLEKLCLETFEHPGFTTGIADELTFAMYLTKIRSYYNYHGNLHQNVQKYFDVNHGHLHIKHYNDRDPSMMEERNLV
jgi:hypothetical protein